MVYSLVDPILDDPLPAPPVRKNILAEAVRFNKFHEENPGLTYEAIGRHFGVTRARVSQLISLVERLPKNFIDQLAGSTDQNVIKLFPYHVLFRISRLPLKEQLKTINQTLLQSRGHLSAPD